ncbi:MAG: biotin--[acetyl-CoA-carboxylase] ligase [candidate division KSB1 bacterium]|nr:biotin--[acetyl-CoA-carboxylase] ligase [candidate division KSB1 bacterium]
MAEIAAKTIGSFLYEVEETASTNLRLKELADDLPHGTVLRAERQTAGRGRFLRAWFSDEQSLTFSILLKLHLLPEHLALAALWPAVAVVRALKEWGIDAACKWPNDVVVGHLKLAGVLIENTIKADSTVQSIVGIGLNVNQTEDDFPPDLIGKAGSMRLIAGRLFDKRQVFFSLLKYLDEAYLRFFHPFAGQELRQAWLEICGHLNRTIQTTVQGETLVGVFLGLDKNGAALLQSGDRIMTITNFDTWEIENVVGD